MARRHCRTQAAGQPHDREPLGVEDGLVVRVGLGRGAVLLPLGDGARCDAQVFGGMAGAFLGSFFGRLILFGYTLGGFGAGRLAPNAGLSNGLLAGIGAFVL